jgi:predicted nucleic acid-binding protein
MAKYKANVALNDNPSVQAAREKNVWFLKRMLEAARKGDLLIFTSCLSITECTQIEPGVPSPPQEVQDFFNMLLCSGRSGITLVQLLQAIQVRARNLKWTEKINLKPLDSVHIATAQHMDCAEFITTDGGIYKNRDKLVQSKMAIIQASETKLLPQKYMQDVWDHVLDSTHAKSD